MAAVNPRDKSRTTGRTTGEPKKGKWRTCFVPHRLEMLLSPAWQAMPIPLGRIVERLEIEHLRHGGQENGYLCVGYNQFVEHGVSRKAIRPALDLGVELGLIRVIVPEDHRGDLRAPNLYELCFEPAKGRHNPTDEWKRVTREKAAEYLARYKSRRDRAGDETERAVA